MSNKIRVAIIGAGLAGQAHAFGYRTASMAVSANLPIELAVIADPNLALAQKVAARYGFAKAVSDIDEVINDPNIDAISVALPNFLHDQVLPRVLASGKHVFTEKPIGRTLAESTNLLGLAKEARGLTGVGFSFRRLPGLAALAQAVAQGLLGEIHTVRAWYNADYASNPKGALSWRYSQEESGGGALLDIGSHAIDALHFVAGQVATVTSATLKTVITERPKPAAGAIGHGGSTSEEYGPVTNDDIALLSVVLENGAVGTISMSRIAHGVPNSLGVEVFGTCGKGMFDSESAGEFHIYVNDPTDGTFNGTRRIITSPAHPYFTDVAAMPGGGVGTGYAEAFTAEIQEFLISIQTGTPMDTSFTTAQNMMRVVDAALKSSSTRQAVKV